MIFLPAVELARQKSGDASKWTRVSGETRKMVDPDDDPVTELSDVAESIWRIPLL